MSAYADRVKDTATTTGTGNFTLAGSPPTGYIAFNTAFGSGGIEAKRFPYAIVLADESEWETGIGYLSAATTLVRETVKQSSNGDAAVDFSAGEKNVFSPLIGYEAQRFLGAGRALLLARGNFLQ
jgi:hypothetical protein